MKYLSTVTLFKFTWDQVAIGFWHRYPNPHSGHVICEDTISRRVVGHRLYTTRLLGKTSVGRLPRWGERLIGTHGRTFYILEESVVDQRNRTLTTYTRNIGLTKIMQIEEKCVYGRNAANPAHTQCRRQAWISSHVLGFSFALQRYGLDRFRRSATRATAGFQHVLQTLFPAKTATPLPQGAGALRRNASKATEIAKARASSVIARS